MTPFRRVSSKVDTGSVSDDADSQRIDLTNEIRSAADHELARGRGEFDVGGIASNADYSLTMSTTARVRDLERKNVGVSRAGWSLRIQGR